MPTAYDLSLAEDIAIEDAAREVAAILERAQYFAHSPRLDALTADDLRDLAQSVVFNFHSTLIDVMTRLQVATEPPPPVPWYRRNRLLAHSRLST